MPRRRTRLALLVLALLAAPATTVHPQGDPALAGDPGYVDFSRQPLFSDDDLEIRVAVKGPMIRVVAEASRGEDPSLADLLDHLRGVEVHVYKVAEGKRDAVSKEISRQAHELEAQGWDEAITIRLRRARGHVFLRLVDQQPVGVAALYLGDEDEAVFVNIVGKIDPAQIGRLASKLNLDLLSQAVEGGKAKAEPPEEE